MSYQEQADLHKDAATRSRLEACIHEQATIFAAGEDSKNAALGNSVIRGNRADIESIIWAVITGPNWSTLDADAAVLGAVQTVWPQVASALYPSFAYPNA